MFTGIVEYKGIVTSVEHHSDGIGVAVDVGSMGEIALGDSVAVNGVCLTATQVHGEVISFDVVPETMSRTNLGSLVVGDSVNIERPLAVSGRFDGHIVQGHVDGIGEIAELSNEGDGTVLSVQMPTSLLRYVVEKGSVTIDGVSLTVAGIEGSILKVALIPHTMEATTLGLRKRGESVNLEVDVLAKYVERLMEFR